MTIKHTKKPAWEAFRRAAPPAFLGELARARWRRYREAVAAGGQPPVEHRELVKVAQRVWACSEFVAETCARYPALLPGLLRGGDLLIAYPDGRYRHNAARALAGVDDAPALARALRLLRHRELVRIAWRDLAGWAPVEETLRELSDLAEACIGAALGCLERWQRRESGVPLGEHSGKPQSLVIIAMGKLGARELNFSSDVDLIFAYPEDGATRRGGIANQQYFVELGQRLIHILSEPTEDGFVYRTDMRLRPFGESGPLAVSFDALEDYYQSHGRPWERYAMVRGRPVTGDADSRSQLMAILRPFVYRRYLDYTAFQELREMKQHIVQEVTRKGLERNIKLGAGGIREVEFIVHAFQLIRGGRRVELQAHGLLDVVDTLRAGGYLESDVCEELKDDYLFLRRLENHLQAYEDRQVHDLPHDDMRRAALAYSLRFGDWASLLRDVDRRRRRIHRHFVRIVSNSRAGAPGQGASPWPEIWQGTMDEGQAVELLAAQGMDEPQQAWDLIQQLHHSSTYRSMTARGREHLERLVPDLMALVLRHEGSAATLRRLLELIERVGQRTVYLALLAEYPGVLAQLVKLCSASPWIAEYITRHPLLLDELLDPRRLYAPLDRGSLRRALEQELARVPATDLEQQMESLRHFKQANTLRVAAADITGVYPLMVVSDHLTEIAETVLAAVLDLAWRHLTSKHGRPHCVVRGKRRPAGFAIIGYGKLGGIELGYGSDLDLVFLHDSDGEAQYTGGPQVIDNGVFFARLGQRIIHILGTFTPSGVLYEVDMRLRPSGASGLLVSNLDSFADYQAGQAWTWEHQALVRARPVAGNAGIAAEFAAIRRRVLSRARDSRKLRDEVRDMRERMREAHGRRSSAGFDLKQDRGGIADIEFMVQYEILRWASARPELLQWTDNIRLLQGLSEGGILPAKDVQFLMDAYRFYRSKVHRLTLQEAPATVSPEEVDAYRPGVERLWRKIMKRSFKENECQMQKRGDGV